MLVRRFVALLLAVTSCAPGVAAGVEFRIQRPAPARDGMVLQRAMLDVHNRARGAVGLAPLAWSPSLAADRKSVV